MSGPRLRQATRALVLDERHRILLVRATSDLEQGRELWLTTGGGMEEGETDEDAVRRELFEEAGLVDFALGPLVWTRTVVHPLAGGRWDGQTERYYLVRTPAFDPAPGLRRDELLREGIEEVRWWTLEELEAAETLFSPRRLPLLLRGLILHGPPAEPVDVGL